MFVLDASVIPLRNGDARCLQLNVWLLQSYCAQLAICGFLFFSVSNILASAQLIAEVSKICLVSVLMFSVNPVSRFLLQKKEEVVNRYIMMIWCKYYVQYQRYQDK